MIRPVAFKRYGMLTAAELASRRGVLGETERGLLKALIVKMGPLPPIADLEAGQVVEAVARDKKVIDGTLHYVLPVGIGKTTVVTDITGAELHEALRGVGLRG